MDEVTPAVITPPPPSELDVARARIRELEAQVAGTQALQAAAERERDASRLALDVELRTPCTLCGKQKLDSL